MKNIELDFTSENKINKILKEYEYVIKIFINKYKIAANDYDDALQEGRLGLLKAINAFVENKGANFLSFASLCIERQILSFLRNQNRKKNKINTYSYSLDSLNLEVESFQVSTKKSEIEDYIVNRLHYNEIYMVATTKMSALERIVYSNFVYGYTISELSEEYQIPKKQVYVIIAKAKKKIEEIINR